jgi:hypothetical protein
VRVQARTRGLLSLLLLAVSAASCAPAVARSPSGAPRAASAIQASISDRLYFGRSIPSGGTVSDADWAAFLHEVVTPRFPAGLTVWRAEGQWRDGTGVIVHEDSFVVELIHDADVRSDAAIGEIAAEYKRRFRQQSVLRVRDRVEVSF